uniref:Probable DNA polymerase n=1 Tax=Russula abietina TaxID=482377 RepID=A0A2S0U3N2_9AGAM|nr:hypothetical protein [Russula abietina]AWB36103.1 hypothetical protein [Russula abietina]
MLLNNLNREMNSLKSTINRRMSSLKTNIKYQKYSHFLLPITTDPLNYGKLISQDGNKFIIQLLTATVLVISQVNNDNFIKLFSRGELKFEFIDSKISETKFTRTIKDQKFTFENNKLITTEILSTGEWITIFQLSTSSNDLTPFNLQERNFSTSSVDLKNNKTKNYLFPKWLEDSKYAAELFILFELFLIFLVYIVFFVLFPENSSNLAIAGVATRIKSKNRWNDLIIPINNKLFNRSLFENEFKKVWNEISLHLNEKNYVYILFKIKYIDGEIVTIGKLQKLTLLDFSWYIDFIVGNMDFKDQFYRDTRIDSILFSYGIKKGIIPSKDQSKFKGTIQKLKNLEIPISMNPEDFGRIIIKKDDIFIIQNNKGQTVELIKSDKINSIEFFKNGISLIKFKDILINSNSFIRIIDNKQYHFENGIQILTSINLKTKFISKMKEHAKEINNFITFDIETFLDSNKNLIPYLLCYFDGKNSTSFWIEDFKNVDELILTCLKSLLVRKYNGYKIYIHNMAKFDIIFLLKYLIQVGKIEPIIHNNKIISIKLKYGQKEEYSIEFKDSYLTLLASLDKLTKGFGVEVKKSIFPHLFVNWDSFNYEGEVPSINYFFKINFTDYENYVCSFNKNWNLKNEAIKYCNIDCVSLYQVIEKFNHLVFELFSINIHKFLTLPSLAFAVFRTKFMEFKNIPQLKGKVEKDIRAGYTGGSVDVFIPRGKNIKCYDVNSLYPFIMYSKEMPIGKSTYFEGNILKINPNAFGFFLL